MRVAKQVLAVTAAAVLLFARSFGAEIDGWPLVTVPGPVSFTGFGWYRAWVKVPDSYFAAHERNLFEESVGVFIRDLAGAHELYVNGLKVGEGGAFAADSSGGRLGP